MVLSVIKFVPKKKNLCMYAGVKYVVHTPYIKLI